MVIKEERISWLESTQSREIEGISNDPDRLVDRKDAATFLGIEPGTLAVWDCTKRYKIPKVRIGRTIRYRLSDLKAFAEKHLA